MNAELRFEYLCNKQISDILNNQHTLIIGTLVIQGIYMVSLLIHLH